jgi:hypothetical protein
LNPVEISKSLEFFCPNMAGCCPIRLKLDTGVQFRYEAVRLRKFGILIASAAPSRLNLLLPSQLYARNLEAASSGEVAHLRLEISNSVCLAPRFSSNEHSSQQPSSR